MQLRWSGHLVLMERLPKRLFYGDVATGSRRQGGQIRRYKDTLKSSLKRLQINPTNWGDLARDRPTWRRTVKTGAVICEASRIAAAQVKRLARKSKLRPVRNADAQPFPVCPRFQRTFRARIGLIGHLRINCTPRTAPIVAPPPASSSFSTPPTKFDRSPEPPLPSSSPSSSYPYSYSSSSAVLTPAVVAPTTHINTTHNPDTSSNIRTTTVDTRGEDQDYTCPHCDRNFTPRVGLVGHLRIHHIETGEPVHGAPTFTHRIRLHCPHRPRTFMHRMSLFSHMRIHEHLWQTTAGCITPPHPLSPSSHRISTPPTASTQLPPPTQVGSVRLDSVSVRLQLHG
ncbi:hypothetical protein SprV_0502020500 [Sparganum proliferum]